MLCDVVDCEDLELGVFGVEGKDIEVFTEGLCELVLVTPMLEGEELFVS